VCDILSPFNEFLLNESGLSLLLILLFVPVFWLLSLVKFMGQFFWLFLLLRGANFFGLIPYSWTVSIYPVVTLFRALIFWSVVSLSNMMIPGFKWNHRRVAHYLPLTTPFFLWGILPVIEIVSQVIRPLTLTVRLTANLVAGHVLIFLVSQLSSIAVFLYFILIPFEIIVAVVQGYVFIMLLDSYSQER